MRARRGFHQQQFIAVEQRAGQAGIADVGQRNDSHVPVMSGGDSRQSSELRTYGIGAQITVDLGIRKMRVLSAPKRMTGLAGFGLEVVEYVETGPANDEAGGE